jgi:16S rRNA (cytosine967-C5)-methyltransferase
VDAALARHPGLAPMDTPGVVQAIATRDLELPAGTHVQLWPHRHGTDAMFIALLTRVES